MSITINTELDTAVAKLQEEYDSDAFRYVYEKISEDIFYICLRYLKNRDEAKDVLQEVFVILYEKISTYNWSGNFEGWVKRIAVNRCIYHLKKRKLSLELKENDIAPVESHHFDFGLEEKQQKQRIKQALQELPDGFRTVINLYVLEGYSHGEIAQILNINKGTSRSQLNRAKAALRKLLNERK